MKVHAVYRRIRLSPQLCLFGRKKFIIQNTCKNQELGDLQELELTLQLYLRNRRIRKFFFKKYESTRRIS